jgi:hypothetical protein
MNQLRTISSPAFPDQGADESFRFHGDPASVVVLLPVYQTETSVASPGHRHGTHNITDSPMQK